MSKHTKMFIIKNKITILTDNKMNDITKIRNKRFDSYQIIFNYIYNKFKSIKKMFIKH